MYIIYMKKFRDGWAEGTHEYHAVRESIALDLKTKDLIGHLWISVIIDQSECLVCFLILHWINSFLHCLKKNCIALNQSEWRNFFMYIISHTKIALRRNILSIQNEANWLVAMLSKKLSRNLGVTFFLENQKEMVWIWSSGWKKSWEGLLVITDISTTWAEVFWTLKMTSAQDVETSVTTWTIKFHRTIWVSNLFVISMRFVANERVGFVLTINCTREIKIWRQFLKCISQA